MCFNYCCRRDKSAFICAGNHLFNCSRVLAFKNYTSKSTEIVLARESLGGGLGSKKDTAFSHESPSPVEKSH